MLITPCAWCTTRIRVFPQGGGTRLDRVGVVWPVPRIACTRPNQTGNNRLLSARARLARCLPRARQRSTRSNSPRCARRKLIARVTSRNGRAAVLQDGKSVTSRWVPWPTDLCWGFENEKNFATSKFAELGKIDVLQKMVEHLEAFDQDLQ